MVREIIRKKEIHHFDARRITWENKRRMAILSEVVEDFSLKAHGSGNEAKEI
jgi:hypothetical protein